MSISRSTEGFLQGLLNVRAVYDVGLCMGCGVCDSACPLDAIQMTLDERKGVYKPSIDMGICTDCEFCVMVCPGIGVDINGLTERFIEANLGEKNLGKYDNFYIGHASSEEIRFNSSSGGLVTALLIYALKEGIIDGALVLGMSAEKPLETRSYIARTPEDVIRARGSKYCPSSLHEGLSQILKEKGRYAVVGLPCHMHGIRKMEVHKPSLREKIVYHFGLFCFNNKTYLATEYYLSRMGIDPGQVREFHYRGGGWPGNIQIKLLNGTDVIIPRGTQDKSFSRRVLFTSAFHNDFIIPRCLLCPDLTNELADIAFGDPWIKEIVQKEHSGKSLLIVRNQVGGSLLAQAMKAGDVVLEEAALELVWRAQNYSSKAGVGWHIQIRQFLGKAIPDLGKREFPVTKKNILAGLKILASYISHHRWLWPIIYFKEVIRTHISHL